MESLLSKYKEKKPEIVFEWHDEETGAEGWIVINSLRNGAAGGGTRMRKGLTRGEVISLAKVMEVKFSVCGPPIGGAKSGINFDPNHPDRHKVLEKWYKAALPILKHYYGTGGDIFTVGVANIYQEQGVGNVANPANFRGTSVDVLMEKVLPGKGVVTLNGEYKNYGVDGNTLPVTMSPGPVGNFGLFQGNAIDFSAMYLFPQKIGIGKLQPYGRYVNNMAVHSPDQDVFEGGMNYVIDGHNARIALSYQRYLANDLNGMTLGFQWQI